MTEDTPTTDDIRLDARNGGCRPDDFDRWLAAHDAVVAREATVRALEPIRHILSSGYGCLICAEEDLRFEAGLEPGANCEHKHL